MPSGFTKRNFRTALTDRHPLFASLLAAGALVLAVSVLAHAQEVFSVQSFPTGSQPLGVDSLIAEGQLGEQYVAVANSGDNTVSLFQVIGSPPSLVPGSNQGLPSLYSVPSPDGVVACGIAGESQVGFLITSSTGTSVAWLELNLDATGTAVSTQLTSINLGSMAGSARCYFQNPGTSTSNPSGLMAAVSAPSDNALLLVSLDSNTLTGSIPNVPGGSALHGIAIDQNGNAWVAGTAANVVTLASPKSGDVLATFSIPQPIAVNSNGGFVYVTSGSGNSVTVFNANTLQVVSQFVLAGSVQGISDVVSYNFMGGTTAEGALAETYDNSLLQTFLGSSGQQANGSSTLNIPGAFGLWGGPLVELGASTSLLMVTSRDSNAIYMIVPSSSPPAQFSVVNSASFASGQSAPGALSSILTATEASQNFSAASVPLPATLGGVSLLVGGSLNFDSATNTWVYDSTGALSAPLLFVGPSQINFQMPPSVPIGAAVPLQLTRADGSALLSTVGIAAANPGIFSLMENGQGQGAVQNQDYSQNSGTNPASVGSVIIIYATGAGATNPALPAGQAATANPLVYTQASVEVTIGGQPAQVEFSGMTPTMVGLWQINAVVPSGITPGDDVPVSIYIGDGTSNTVTIAVQ